MKKRLLHINRFSKSASAYALSTVVDLVVPMVTFPYILFTLGLQAYGAYALTQYVLSFALVLTDAGLSVVGPTAIGSLSARREELPYIVNAQFARLLVASFIAILGMSIVFLVEQDDATRSMWGLTAIVCIGQSMSMDYVWVGLQMAGTKLLYKVLSRVAFLLLLLTTVASQNDLLWLLGIQAMVSLIPIVGMYRLFRIYGRHGNISLSLRTSGQLLYSNRKVIGTTVLLGAKACINGVLLGVFSAKEVVGLYSSVEKVVVISYSAYSVIVDTYGPVVARVVARSRATARSVLKSALLCTFAVASLQYIVVSVSANSYRSDLGVLLSQDAVALLNIMAVNILIAPVSIIIGSVFMLGYGHHRLWSKLYGVYSVAGVVLAIILLALCGYDALIAVSAYTLTQAILAIGSVTVLYFKINAPSPKMYDYKQQHVR